MTALNDLAVEDAAITSGGSSGSDLATQAPRDAVTRLLEAGERVGLSVADVGLYFDIQLQTKFQGQVPGALQNKSGGLNTELLFQVFQVERQSAANLSEDEYLALITQEGATTKIEVDTGSQDEPAVQTEVVVPEPPEDADPVVRAILQRIEVRDDRRVITAIAGDTLARIAFAVYGDALRYRDIYAANTNILAGPNRIEIGDVIFLPEIDE